MLWEHKTKKKRIASYCRQLLSFIFGGGASYLIEISHQNAKEQNKEEGLCLDLVVVSKNEFRRYTKSLGINTNENIQNGILVNTIYHSTVDKNNKTILS